MNRNYVFNQLRFEILFMDQIKQQLVQGQPKDASAAKRHSKLKEAAKMALKQYHDMVSQLSKFHNGALIQTIDCDFQQTKLQKYLQIKSEQRNQSEIRGIKAQLQLFSAFRIKQNYNTTKQTMAIMAYNLDLIMGIFAKFMHLNFYPKGSLIQVVTQPRDKIRIMIRGQVAVYQPIHQRSLKNCYVHYRQSGFNLEWLNQAIKNLQSYRQRGNKTQRSINPEEIQKQLQYYYLLQKQNIPEELAQKILTQCGIISWMAPHTKPTIFKKMGQLICSSKRPLLVGQPSFYQQSVICLSDVYTMEIQESVYRHAVQKLDNNKEKRYIRALLRKFQLFQYFDAKIYVKSDYMIEPHESQSDKQKALLKKPSIQTDLNNTFLNHIYHQQENRSKKKAEIDSQQPGNYEIKYSGQIYLIVDGQVTISVDRIEETKLSHQGQARTVKHRTNKHLLKLISPDIFGFEQIGQIRDYNLTYIVQKSCRLLKLNQDTLLYHFEKIQGFQDHYTRIKTQRDQLVKNMIKGISQQMKQSQLRRYRSLINLQQHKSTPKLEPIKIKGNLISKVEYIGKHKFDQISDNLQIQLLKRVENQAFQLRAAQIVKSGAPLKESLSFASRYRKDNNLCCNVVGDFVQVRNKAGRLMRKAKLEESEGDQIVLRKFGVISQQQRTKHNLLVAARRSMGTPLPELNVYQKQMAKIRKEEQSLPKINYYYSRKAKIQYDNMHKLDL